MLATFLERTKQRFSLLEKSVYVIRSGGAVGSAR